jgi:hypothetical protein
MLKKILHNNIYFDELTGKYVKYISQNLFNRKEALVTTDLRSDISYIIYRYDSENTHITSRKNLLLPPRLIRILFND